MLMPKSLLVFQPRLALSEEREKECTCKTSSGGKKMFKDAYFKCAFSELHTFASEFQGGGGRGEKATDLCIHLLFNIAPPPPS